MPAASTATQRAEERQTERNAAALELAILRAIVNSTALQATRARGGMQCSPPPQPCATVELRNQDSGFESVFIHLNNVKGANSVELANGTDERVGGTRPPHPLLL